MTNERECALDAEGERLKGAREVKPAPPSACATRRPARMIAVPGLDMLRRTGFTADAAPRAGFSPDPLPPAVEGFIPGNAGSPHVMVKAGRGEVAVKADPDAK